MKNWRITYRPFGTSTLEASDIVIPAESAEDARAKFESHYDQYLFVSARQE